MAELGQIFRHQAGRRLVINNSPIPIIDTGAPGELAAQQMDLAGAGLFPAVLRSTGRHTFGSVLSFLDLISLDGNAFEPFFITQGRDLEVQAQRVFLLGLGVLPTIIEVTT